MKRADLSDVDDHDEPKEEKDPTEIAYLLVSSLTYCFRCTLHCAFGHGEKVGKSGGNRTGSGQSAT